MSFIDAFKAIVKRVAQNLITAINRLSSKDVLVSDGGEIVIKEPIVKAIADKGAAIVLASAALFFLMSPIQGAKAMAIGDQLMRAATYMWSGTEVWDAGTDTAGNGAQPEDLPPSSGA